MLSQKVVDQILEHPEIKEAGAKLKEMNAPWESIQVRAVDTAAREAVTKEDAFRIILRFILQQVNEWESRREPKTKAGRMIKAVLSWFGSWKSTKAG